MSATIFAVHEYGGKWDDAYDDIVQLWSTYDLAAVHISKLEVRRVHLIDVYDRQDAFISQWNEKNPTPTAPVESTRDRTAWDDGPQRRRDEFDAIHKNLREEARLEFLRSIGLSEEELESINPWGRPSWLDDRKYSIEEMEVY